VKIVDWLIAAIPCPKNMLKNTAIKNKTIVTFPKNFAIVYVCLLYYKYNQFWIKKKIFF
jgi:hypothetical protein